jgi:hypothetical protein
MKKFNVNKLPSFVKSTYESQLKWADKNWKDTLRLRAREINALLDDISVFDLWKEILGDKYDKIGQNLLPEIYMDVYVSIHFACMGLYKQSHVCLRAELENTLRLVYFAVHPVEYGWWCSGKDFFKKRNVWAEDYRYFRQLDEVQKFQQVCKKGGHKVDVYDGVRILYGKLSQYVHTGPTAFLTTPERFAPKYRKPEFNKWLNAFKETQKFINLILVLGFPEDFKKLTLPKKKKILKKTGDTKTKAGLRKSVPVKFVGGI